VRDKGQSGQVIVILLLIMLIGLTLGLSITSRTLQQMKVTSVSEQSARAFTAAEAAIEEALRQELSVGLAGDIPTGVLTGVERAHYEVTEKSQEFSVDKDQAYQFDLISPHWDGAQTIKICWKDPDDSPLPSLELTFIAEDKGDYFLKRFPVNAEPVSPENCFLNPGSTQWCDGSAAEIVNHSVVVPGDCDGFTNQVDIPADSITQGGTITPVIMRIKPFYSRADLRLIGVEGQVFTVEGEGEAFGEVTRKVQVKKAPPALPPIFDYVIFDGSGNALQK
jgi:hypothetical protein